MSVRPFNSDFWMGSYVYKLPPYEKLIYCYLINNPMGNIAGIFGEHPEQFALHLGIPVEIITATLDMLEKDGKIIRYDGTIALTKWGRHQSGSPAVFEGITRVLMGLSRDHLYTLSVGSGDGPYTLPRGYQWKNVINRHQSENPEEYGDGHQTVPGGSVEGTAPIPILIPIPKTDQRGREGAENAVGRSVDILPSAAVPEDAPEDPVPASWWDSADNVLGLTEDEVRNLDRPEYGGVYLDEEYKKICADAKAGRLSVKDPARFLVARVRSKLSLKKT